MSRQLAHSETEELFAVCRRYAVHYYDVQIEFVDHLATLIEDIWEKEGIIIQDLYPGEVEAIRKENPLFNGLRPEIYYYG